MLVCCAVSLWTRGCAARAAINRKLPGKRNCAAGAIINCDLPGQHGCTAGAVTNRRMPMWVS